MNLFRTRTPFFDNCPKGGAQEFLAFLRNRGKLIVGEPKILNIDRSKPFDPKFVGEGWTIDEEDERSIALTKIDLTSVHFETTLKSGESSIQGEKKLQCLKDVGYVRLDAKVFQTLWENKYMIPETWKRNAKGEVRYIYFDGTILRGTVDSRGVLYLYFNDGKWRWLFGWLDLGRSAQNPSAVLATHFISPPLMEEFCLSSCPCQLPNILPTSDMNSDKTMYFLSSSA